MKRLKSNLKVFTYPKPKQLAKMTGIVVTSAFVVSIIIAAESTLISSVISVIFK
ncbi:MAG: preprotein translocase subunit SecE [Eubacteriales bacterium]|nr:preprotein translocase subunit SecE [Eubacteriales bacterium]